MAEMDLSLMGRALDKLEEGLRLYASEPENEVIRDALIQRFEFTYELTIKTLRRYLRDYAAGVDRDRLEVLPYVIRTAWSAGLTEADWERWKEFRDARNKTSHLYSEPMVKEVVRELPAFYAAARYLHAQMRKAVE